MPKGLHWLPVVLITTSAAHGEIVTLDSIAHGTLYETAGSQTANGLGQHLFAGNNGQDLSRRGLIRFDLASLGPNVLVESVVLRLHVSQANAAASEVSLHRMLAPWGVGTTDAGGGEGGGGAATPGSATWTHAFFDDVPWDTPGGDFDLANLASTTVGGVDWYEWSGSGLVDHLQGVVDGTTTDHGWLLRGDESMASTAKRFDSMFADPAFHPELVVTYSVVPAPGVVALFGVAGIGGRRRRH